MKNVKKNWNVKLVTICKKIRTSKYELKKRTRKFEIWFVTEEYNWKIINENIKKKIAIKSVYNPEKLKKMK